MSIFRKLSSVDCQECDWRRRAFPWRRDALILAAREHTTKTEGHLVVLSEAQ